MFPERVADRDISGNERLAVAQPHRRLQRLLIPTTFHHGKFVDFAVSPMLSTANRILGGSPEDGLRFLGLLM